MEPLDRAFVAQSAVDAFDAKPLDFKDADCIRLGVFVMRAMGHKPKGLKGLRWSTEMGALKAMKRSGFKTLLDAIDAQGFERIAPARALPGDLVALPCDGPWGGSIMVCVGNGRLFGFLEGRAGVVEPKSFVCAWRVPCRKLSR
jgi:hypothetical protein